MSEMRRYKITITGVTPLIMHSDNIEWADKMDRWRRDPANKSESKAGDDRSPAWRWLGCLYHDSGRIVIPADNLQKVMSEGGAMVPTGKGQKTFKAQTQSGVIVDDAAWPLRVADGEPIEMEEIEQLLTATDFEEHQEHAKALGFELFVKRAKVGMSKHIRVRPRFPDWSASGTVTVVDAQITDEVLADVWRVAGQYKGLGDWRPGAPKAPGPWGRFESAVERIR